MHHKHEVIVGNIGTVYSGANPVKAAIAYGVYKRKSLAGDGRAASESVTWMRDGHIKKEHLGPLDPTTGWIEGTNIE